MAATKANPRLGAIIQRYRQDAGLTQAELAQASGLKVSYITALELGRLQLIYPEPFNALRRQLLFPGWSVLEAIGYRTDADSNGEVNPALLTLIREKMDDDAQVALLGVVRSWLKGSAA